MKLPKDFEEVVKKIDWLETAKLVMPIVQPFVQGALWYGFTNFDKRAQALSRFIAIAEVIPAVDLNLPRGVVLASMYDGIEDALKVWTTLIDTLQNIPEQVKELIKETKEDIEELIPDKDDILDPIKENEAVIAVGDCIANAKKNLGYLYYTPAGAVWVYSCMIQKGFDVSRDWVKKQI